MPDYQREIRRSTPIGRIHDDIVQGHNPFRPIADKRTGIVKIPMTWQILANQILNEDADRSDRDECATQLAQHITDTANENNHR